MLRNETEYKLRFGGSMAEVENEVGWALSCRGSETERNLKFGGSVAETLRYGPFRWTRNVIKFEVQRKRDGSLSRPVPFHLKPIWILLYSVPSWWVNRGARSQRQQKKWFYADFSVGSSMKRNRTEFDKISCLVKSRTSRKTPLFRPLPLFR